jgi:hypothetical protein
MYLFKENFKIIVKLSSVLKLKKSLIFYDFKSRETNVEE